MEEMISISKKRYKELLKAEDKLSMLEAYGVDNWDCYGEAMKALKEECQEDISMFDDAYILEQIKKGEYPRVEG